MNNGDCSVMDANLRDQELKGVSEETTIDTVTEEPKPPKPGKYLYTGRVTNIPGTGETVRTMPSGTRYVLKRTGWRKLPNES